MINVICWSDCFLGGASLPRKSFSHNPSVSAAAKPSMTPPQRIQAGRCCSSMASLNQALGYQAQLGNIQLTQQFEDLHYLAVLHDRISLYYDGKLWIGRFQLT